MKRLLAFSLSLLLIITATACEKSDKDTVAVLLPTKYTQRWVDDGNALTSELTSRGYNVDLQYAGDDISVQINQVENMIAKQVKAIVITPIDGSTLSGVLKRADDAGVDVISYDRLIANTDTLDAYITFDNYYVGVSQGTFIEEAYLASGKDTFVVEIFGGDPADNNAYFFFDGAMEVLGPYIESGKMIVKSGQTEFSQCATQSWSAENSQKRMENLITRYYADGGVLDAILSPNDSIAMGCLTALKVQGYVKRNGYPVVVGQDGSLSGVKLIYDGEQSMSIFKDGRVLALHAAIVCDDLLKGRKPEFNDTTTYNNGSVVVPAYLCDIEMITKDNIQEKLIDTGMYTMEQITTE